MTIERDINEPIIYKLYYKIRKTLTPTQNIYYLLSESVFIGLILFYLLYTYTIINELIIVFTSFSFVISILVRFLFIEPDKKNREDIVLKFDTKQSIYSYIVSIIPLVTLFIFYNIFNILLLLVLFNSVYIYTLYYRSKKYMIQHNFFINTHSNVVSNWHKASYFLQNGINTFDEGYQFRSYYWFKRSQEQYKYINENEDRKSLREGANELIESNKLFSYLNFVEEIEYEFYYREANMHIKQANEYFSTRFCDSCNKRKKIMNMSMFISEEDNTYNIYCNSCYNNQSTNNTKSQNNKNTYKQNKKQNNKNTYKQNKKQNNSKRNNINNKDNIMTVSKAKKILNIKGSVTEDKLNKKYKQAVKKTHPDVGGSVDEFKKTQEAKDVLESHIS